MSDNEDVLNPRNGYSGIMANILNVGSLSHASDSGELEDRSGSEATNTHTAKRLVCMIREPDAKAGEIAFGASKYTRK
jgi:hypothetical protein